MAPQRRGSGPVAKLPGGSELWEVCLTLGSHKGSQAPTFTVRVGFPRPAILEQVSANASRNVSGIDVFNRAGQVLHDFPVTSPPQDGSADGQVNDRGVHLLLEPRMPALGTSRQMTPCYVPVCSCRLLIEDELLVMGYRTDLNDAYALLYLHGRWR